MKNFLRNLMGFNHLQEANNILSNKIVDLQRELDGLEESVKDDLLSDIDYELDRKVETEVDDRLDLDDMQSDISDLKEDMNNFDHQVSVMAERVNVLADKLDTLSILDRLSALEEKLND